MLQDWLDGSRIAKSWQARSRRRECLQAEVPPAHLVQSLTELPLLALGQVKNGLGGILDLPFLAVFEAVSLNVNGPVADSNGLL